MRLVDAMPYRKELEEEIKFHKDCDNREIVHGLEIAIADLGDAPTIDAARVVHGHWRLETDEEEPNFLFKLVICSVCGKTANGTYNYCPNCGAKMDLAMEY